MTRSQHGRRTAADSSRGSAAPGPLGGRHRVPRPGRHRIATGARSLRAPDRRSDAARTRHRAELHRRARYAAAGLLALSGALAAPTLGDDSAAGLAAHSVVRPLGVRPVAGRQVPAARRPCGAVRRPPVRAAAVRRAARTRWVTRTVAGPVLHGRATWYGPGFAGRRTASGEVFRPASAMTAAHRTLPFGTRLRVCHGHRCVDVRINDRGPFGNAILDLSWLAAHRLGMTRAGIVPVTATVLTTRRVRVAA